MRSFALALCLFFTTANGAQPIAIVVHAEQPGAVIDRHVYGQFAEHLGHGIYDGIWVGDHSAIPNERGFRKDVIAALRALEVPVVRWPGGCFADEYHWRDGIGPRDQRPVTVNTNWGGVAEPNQFGTHEFMDFVELIGADAYINGNLGTGSPREMAEWLQYLTSDQQSTITAERAKNGHPKPWKVAYFAVGNEAWGCGGNMSPDYYADQFRQSVAFLKAPPGLRPQIIASGGHDNDTTWTDVLAKRAPQLMNAVTLHYYTIPTGDFQHKGASAGFDESAWISTLANAMKMDELIRVNIDILDRLEPAKTVGLAVDEWGSWYDTEPGREPGFLYQQNTLRDALVAALTFNIFHRHADRIHMANIAQMVNVLQAMILTDGPKMMLTPTYHVFSMFRPFHDAIHLPTDIQSPDYQFGDITIPALSVSAGRTTGGAVVVAMVNTNPTKSYPLEVTLIGATPSTVSGQILSAGAMDAHNTFEKPHTIEPKTFSRVHLKGRQLSFDLPAKSIVVVTMH